MITEADDVCGALEYVGVWSVLVFLGAAAIVIVVRAFARGGRSL